MRLLMFASLVAVAIGMPPALAGAASKEAHMECDSTRDGYKLRLVSTTFQNTIAEGRTTVDLLTTIRTAGVATFTVTADGATVGSTQVPSGSMSYSDENRWASISGLPPRGNLDLLVTLSPASDGWNTYTCPRLTLPIKRTAGVPLLGPWSYGSDASRESVYMERAAWGKFAYIEATGGVKWIRGSCQNLSLAPVAIEVRSSGVAGSRASKTSVRDQCDLVPPAKVKRKVKILAGTITVGTGAVSVTSTLRVEGEQRYKTTMTIGKAKRSFSRTAAFTPSYRIWQGTDSFWNTCVSDGRDIRSEGGKLYCVEPSRLFM